MFLRIIAIRIREIILIIQDIRRNIFNCVNGEDMSPIPAVNSDESFDSN